MSGSVGGPADRAWDWKQPIKWIRVRVQLTCVDSCSEASAHLRGGCGPGPGPGPNATNRINLRPTGIFKL